MIEAYFQTHGIKHLELIKRGLKQDLPRDVRKRIEEQLETTSD